ncbi:hypothetical protein SDC9_206182 [bioreactor metagenome]|uniref:HTH marR-type domain-containing protein n=1 Tax=bioreactor metagenome TaxID=1076179 RepID=A0A645J510_9ZZZZ
MRFFAESDESPRDIGRRLLCLLFIAGKGDISTQKELAKRLGVTPARVCQLLAKLNVRDLMKAPQTLSNSDARH